MLKHVGSNWAVMALQLGVLMFLTPFVVRTLGGDLNGVWVAIVSLAGFLQLLTLGVPMASVRYIAEAVADEDVDATNRAISTCLGIYVAVGALALAAGGALWIVFDRAYLTRPEYLALGPGWIADARLAFAIVAVQVAFGFAMRLPYGILEAHHEFPAKNAIEAVHVLLRAGSIVALLSWRVSLAALAWVEVGSMLFVFGAALLFIRRRHPHLRFGVGGFDRALVRSVLGFSIFAMLLNVGSMLAFRTDAIVIGGFLEPLAITEFDNGNKFFEPLTMLVLGIGMVVMPTATKLRRAGRTAELKDVFLKWSKVSLSLVLVVGLYLLVLGPEFLGWWIAPKYEGPSGRVLQILMLSFLLYLPVRGVALPILMGLGQPARPAAALLVMGAVNVALSVALVGPFGIEGVALGTAIPNVLFALAVLRLTCRELDTTLGEYLRYVAGRAAIGALAPLALLLWFKLGLGVQGFALLPAGAAMVVVFALTWVFFVYGDDRYVDLRRLVLARLWRARA